MTEEHRGESLADIFDLENALVVVTPKTPECDHWGHVVAGEYVRGKGTKVYCTVCDGRWYADLKEDLCVSG